MMTRILPVLGLALFTSHLSAHADPIIQKSVASASAAVKSIDQLIQAEGKKGKDYSTCAVALLTARKNYDEWFISHAGEFEALSASMDALIQEANQKIQILEGQHQSVNAVKGNDSGSVEISYGKLVNYFKLLNERLQSKNKNDRDQLLKQQSNPKLNPLHISHEQAIEAMNQMTVALNSSLKEASARFEVTFNVTSRGFTLVLQATTEQNGKTETYRFPLLTGLNSAKWSALAHSSQEIDHRPIDGYRRYRAFLDAEKGNCESFPKIMGDYAETPYLTYVELVAHSKKTAQDRARTYTPTGMEFVGIPGTDIEMQTTEVTQQQWFEVMGYNPSHFKDTRYCQQTWRTDAGGICPTNPVESISMVTALAFIEKLNQKQNVLRYRLPTNAEWTAALGELPKGNLGDYAWYQANAGAMDLEYTRPVGMKKPNQYGLYDMLGNVWEFTRELNATGAETELTSRGGCIVNEEDFILHTGTLSWNVNLATKAAGFRLVRETR